jgi:hypothetical protein
MMNDSQGDGQANDGRAGLCATCAHVNIIASDRGSRFYMCRLSSTDPRFPRYPLIPVAACAGYRRTAALELRSDHDKPQE